MMAILLQLLVEMAQKVFFLNRETEIHKSERINKFTVDDVCPDYYWVDFEKDQSDWQGRTKKHDQVDIYSLAKLQ